MTRPTRAPLARDLPARAALLLLSASLLLALGSCQKVIGLPAEKPDYATAGAAAPKPVKASQKCKDYCAAATTRCVADKDTGLGSIYASENSCLTLCTELEAKEYIATVDDDMVDPIECRELQVNQDENRAVSCFGGSPTAAGNCGNVCELYCALYRNTCSEFCDDHKAVCTVPPEDDCQRQCESLRVDGKSRDLMGGTFDQLANYDGDSLQCRFLHLVNALTDPATHCAHAAFNSNSHCLDKPDAPLTCQEYCKVVEGACTKDGDTAVYESQAQCLAVCGAMTDAGLLGMNQDGAYTNGVEPEDSPNTIGCRRTHSYFAFSAPDLHCAHAGPLGAPVCADPCESFCVLKQQACPANPKQSDADCRAECAEIDGLDTEPDYSIRAAKKGGGLNCRMLHLARALEIKGAAARGPECAIVQGTTRCAAE